MISFGYLSLLVFCIGCASGERPQEDGSSPVDSAPRDVAQRVLTNDGYMIRYGDTLYAYPFPAERRVQQVETNLVETNEIGGEEREDRRRPLFFFTYEAPAGSPQERIPSSRPYIEIRKKREADEAAVPESSKVGKLRRKRTYCRKCGKGGGGYYVPVTYAVYPVYYGGGGGKGHGCSTCGGGYPSYGGGGGGSFSFSSSSAHSSSGSFGWGKK